MVIRLMVAFSILFLGCSNEPPTIFEVNTESTFVIPAGLDNFRTHTFIIRNIPTRINTVFDESNEDLVAGIFPNRAEVRAPFVNFDFTLIQSAIINIWSPQDPDGKKEVFFMEFVTNQNRSELQLFSSLSEVKDILLKNTFDAEIKLIFRTFTPTEIESRLSMNFVAHGRQ